MSRSPASTDAERPAASLRPADRRRRAVAGLLGVAILRTALASIERFVGRTEEVTSELDHPRRLEATGAGELRRLAASFNQTLDALERSIEAQRNLVADASTS